MNLAMPVAPKRSRSWRPLLLFTLCICLVGGLIYWLTHVSITLDDARLLHSGVQLTSPASGKVATVDVRPGQRVKKDDVIFTFDPRPLQDELAKAAADLAAIAATLPPEALAQVTQPQGIPTQQVLEEALDRRRADETAARKQVEAASFRHSKATYEATRAQLQLSRGRTNKAQLESAQDARQKADADLAAAKSEFEKVSLARASIEEKIQRLRTAAQQTGTANMPVFMRIKAYEGQLATVQAAQAHLDSAVVHSPRDGIVNEIFVEKNVSILAGSPYMTLGIVGEMTPLVVGYTTSPDYARIKNGQRCKVALSGVGKFSGVVESTAMVASPPFPPRKGDPHSASAPAGYFVVQVRLDATTTYDFAALPELSTATVSVILD